MNEIRKLRGLYCDAANGQYRKEDGAKFDAILDQLKRLLPPEGETRGWKCKANRAADPPQDCDWPTCGCDPYALKVIDALEEAGILTVDPAPSSEKALGAPDTPDPIIPVARDYIEQLRELARRKPDWRDLMRRMANCWEATLEPRRALLASSPTPSDVRIDPTMPNTEIRAEQDGKVVGRIVNIVPPAPEGKREERTCETCGRKDKPFPDGDCLPYGVICLDHNKWIPKPERSATT